jgi:hypothetical protein
VSVESRDNGNVNGGAVFGGSCLGVSGGAICGRGIAAVVVSDVCAGGEVTVDVVSGFCRVRNVSAAAAIGGTVGRDAAIGGEDVCVVAESERRFGAMSPAACWVSFALSANLGSRALRWRNANTPAAAVIATTTIAIPKRALNPKDDGAATTAFSRARRRGRAGRRDGGPTRASVT